MSKLTQQRDTRRLTVAQLEQRLAEVRQHRRQTFH